MSPCTALDRLNGAPPVELAEQLRGCAPIESWVRHLIASRPYPSRESLLAEASARARTWTTAEVLGALAHHPRIGERAGDRTVALSAVEAEHSAAEQAGVDDPDAWVLANSRYERRFGTVFLIRAAGRSQAEMLAELERRLLLDDEEERAERAEQLRQIALLRLDALVAD